MALRLIKAVVQPVATEVPKIVVPPVESAVIKGAAEVLTEEYLILHKTLQAIEAKEIMKRMDVIRKELQQTAYSLVEDTKPAIFTCDLGEIEFGERTQKTEILNPRVLITLLEQKFGAQVAWSVVEIALTPLRSILSEAELAKVSTKVPGVRVVKEIRLKAHG